MAAGTGLLQLEQQVRIIQQREKAIEDKFKATSRGLTVATLAEVEDFPIDESGCICGCDDEMKEKWEIDINMFMTCDTQTGGRAQQVWPEYLTLVFPFMVGWSLPSMLLALLMRCHYHRQRGAAVLQYVEVFCGKGNLSRACIAAGLLGVSLDICVNSQHDVLTSDGLRLLLLAITAAVPRALLWVATPCSSFVILSSSVCQRNLTNLYMGNTERFCVQQGNVLADISGLALLLGVLLGLEDGMEQPSSSCLPETPVVNAVLRFGGYFKTDTYHYCFGGPTLKPLQLWSHCDFVSALARSRPSVPSMEASALAKKNDDGSFTGRHELLVESQEYTMQFGRCVVTAYLGQN